MRGGRGSSCRRSRGGSALCTAAWANGADVALEGSGAFQSERRCVPLVLSPCVCGPLISSVKKRKGASWLHYQTDPISNKHIFVRRHTLIPLLITELSRPLPARRRPLSHLSLKKLVSALLLGGCKYFIPVDPHKVLNSIFFKKTGHKMF